jgi:hypothetical protein
LLGGYILNYVIYQPQIQNLANGLGALNAEVENYGNAINNLNAAISKLNATVSGLNSTTSQSNSTSPKPTPTPSNESAIPEDLEFLSANATKIGKNFEVDFSLQNTGVPTATLAELSLNGIPQDAISDLTSITFNGTTYSAGDPLIIPLNAGDTVNGTLTLIGGVDFVSGMSVDLTIWTAVNNYSVTVVLP